jgi:glycosyltransferase involved in cell wall biosynthesis
MIDIIIPVYNEGKNIIKLIEKINLINLQKIISICYDNENDTTLKHIENLDNIRLVKNKSVGPTKDILEGIKTSKSKIILIYMADDFDNILIIEEMYYKILQGYDLIIPSRFIEGGEFNSSNYLKKTITKIGSFLINNISGIPFRDSTNAFKMFKVDILDQIKLKSKIGFTFAIELTVKAHLNNYKILEIPSKWNELPNRKSNFKIFKWIPFYFYWFLFAFVQNRILKFINFFHK